MPFTVQLVGDAITRWGKLECTRRQKIVAGKQQGRSPVKLRVRQALARSLFSPRQSDADLLYVIAHLTEQPPDRFHEVAVSRDARGNYYCSFVYDDPVDNEMHKEPKKLKQHQKREDGIVAFDLGIKTLATGANDQGRFYHIGGFKGYRWYNKQLDNIRSKRDRCKKKSRRYIYLSKVYKRVSERKRTKQRDCLHKASSLIAGKLAERAVVIGDLCQRQMVIKKQEQNKRRVRNRLVYNDWGLYSFVQMLHYKCVRFGKELSIIDERDTTKLRHACECKQAMPLWKRT